MPWLAIDEVLRVAGWRRNDVDAIATTRGWFPTYHDRFPLWRELHYTFERWRGRGARPPRAVVLCHRFGITDTHKLFRADRFLKDHSFRPDTQVHFVNHHEAHALAALFYTDWDDALIYTSDGIGDNVSYSMRSLKDGKLECHYGDDRWLTPDAEGDRARQRLRLRHGGVRLPHAAPRGQAHRARGLRQA